MAGLVCYLSSHRADCRRHSTPRATHRPPSHCSGYLLLMPKTATSVFCVRTLYVENKSRGAVQNAKFAPHCDSQNVQHHQHRHATPLQTTRMCALSWSCNLLCRFYNELNVRAGKIDNKIQENQKFFNKISQKIV